MPDARSVFDDRLDLLGGFNPAGDHLLGREPEHQAWKRAVLAREIELEEVDTGSHGFTRPKLSGDRPTA